MVAMCADNSGVITARILMDKKNMRMFPKDKAAVWLPKSGVFVICRSPGVNVTSYLAVPLGEGALKE